MASLLGMHGSGSSRGRARGRGRGRRGRGGAMRGGRGRGRGRSGKRKRVTQPGGDHKFVIRGIYDEAEEDPEWRAVPAFDTKEEAEAFTKEHITSVCTNPKYPQCCHVFTTLCDWEQIETLLLPKIAFYRRKYPVEKPANLDRSSNVFAQHPKIVQNVLKRANLDFHAKTNEESTLNTLRYLFFHMRCGIFVMIRRRRVMMFVPFVNHHYRNTWAKYMSFDHGNTLDSYYSKKEMQNRHEDILPDVSRWWANGNIICNVESANFWGDTFLPQLKEMLQRCCRERDVPDCEFFINKRDFPQLKADLSEPYDFLFPEENFKRDNEMYSTYAPIVSFFVADNFADYPWPNTDDWETAVGLVYPPRCVDLRSKKNRKQFHVPWADKQATAVFRGNSTGGGVTPETNQRLHLSLLSQQWARSPKYGPGNPVDGVQFLDAGVVNWNIRDKKLHGQPMTFLDKRAIQQRLRLSDRIPMFQQAKYKYLIYVEGHCAAARYASLMAFGSVIIKVESTTQAKDMWYFPLLTPFRVSDGDMDPKADHVSVQPDLSDLGQAIEWLKTHDAEAERMVENASALARKYLHLEGILDYMHMCLHEMAVRFTPTQGSEEGSTPVTDGSGAGVGAGAGAGAGAGPSEASKDWFGADNVPYCGKALPLRKPPVIPELASMCECTRCQRLEQEAAARAAAAPAPAAKPKRQRKRLNLRGKAGVPKFKASGKKLDALLARAKKRR